MPQRHMEQDVFDAILTTLPVKRCTVSLQGEGEPMLHPRFVAMAKQVIDAGHIPYTITNASRLDPETVSELFPQIGISLDTSDPDEAQRIGRGDLQQVVANLDHLIACVGPDRIILHTVNYGQQLETLRKFAHARGISRHIVQPLQTKHDYHVKYANIPLQRAKPVYHLRCRYLQQPRMRYFDVTGLEMPCCYIKDTGQFVSLEHTRTTMRQGQLPNCCIGCREIAMRSL